MTPPLEADPTNETASLVLLRDSPSCRLQFLCLIGVVSPSRPGFVGASRAIAVKTGPSDTRATAEGARDAVLTAVSTTLASASREGGASGRSSRGRATWCPADRRTRPHRRALHRRRAALSKRGFEQAAVTGNALLVRVKGNQPSLHDALAALYAAHPIPRSASAHDWRRSLVHTSLPCPHFTENQTHH
jgi:hypothetical protein